MAGEAREFQLQIDAEWAEMMGGVARAVQHVGVEAHARVQERSPVDTGQFRANWLLSVGETDGRIFEGPSPEPGALSAGAIAAYPLTGDVFPAIHLQNNLPYATRLEDGSSTQAPSGVVAVTVAELEALWERQTV